MTSTVTKADKVSSFVTRLYKGLQKPLNYRTTIDQRLSPAVDEAKYNLYDFALLPVRGKIFTHDCDDRCPGRMTVEN